MMKILIFGWTIPLFQAAVNWIHSLKKDFQEMYVQIWQSQCINEVECTATAGLMFMQKHPPHTHSHTTAPTLHCNPLPGQELW